MSLTFDQIVARKKGNSLPHTLLKQCYFTMYSVTEYSSLGTIVSPIVEMQCFRSV